MSDWKQRLLAYEAQVNALSDACPRCGGSGMEATGIPCETCPRGMSLRYDRLMARYVDPLGISTHEALRK